MGTYLSRTLSSPNVNKFTISQWVKGISLSGDDYLFALADGGHHVHVRRDGNMKLQSQLYNGGVQIGQLISSAVYRDPASWYHVVYRQDIENSTANQRNRLYVNGEEMTYGTQTNPSSTNAGSGMSLNIFKTTSYSGTGNNFTGYMTDLNYFDGYSYGPDSFGETDSTTGEWKPKVDFTGVTYGTNGFRCQFGNAAALGTDTSGNSNTLTVNNAGTNAKTVDTATNNFCTLNPLQQTTAITLSNGNLVATNTSNDQGAAGTMAFSAGKWYWEVKLVNKVETGINLDSNILQLSNDSTLGSNDNNLKQTALVTNSAGGSNDFRFNGSTETVNSTACSNGDILMVAVDADNTKIYYGKNGTWMNSGNPAGGSGELKNFSSGYTAGNFITPTFQNGLGSTASCQFNFGNPPFTIASGNADANGHGNFEYAVPSGYYALCTKNINSYG